MLVSALITETLYDLRDPDGTTYTKDGAYAELLSYLNRGVRTLNAFLVGLSSDLVHATATLTISEDDNYVAASANFITERSLWIGTSRLQKLTVDEIYRQQKHISTDGEPTYYSIEGLNFIFERDADADYSLTVHYNSKPTALVVGSAMPYNDIFNDSISKSVVIQAKNRNELGVNIDAVLEGIFHSAATAYVVSRNYAPNRYRSSF